MNGPMMTSVTPNTDICRLANQRYDQLLGTKYLDSTAAAIRAATGAQGSAFGDTLRPYFISPATEALAYSAAQEVGQAIRLVAQHFATNRALWPRLQLNAAQQAALEFSFTTPTSLLNRFDGFVLPNGGIQFMECNPTPPGGMVYVDELTEVFLKTPIFSQLREEFSVRSFAQAPKLVPAVLASFEHFGGRGKPRIALVTDRSPKGQDNADGTPRSTIDVKLSASVEMQHTIKTLQQEGIEILIAGPHQLSYENGVLTLAGARIDAVVVSSWEPLLQVGRAHPVFAAARDRAVWIINSPVENVFLGNKSVLALLSDPAFTDDVLPEHLQAAVGRHIPWSRVLRNGVTAFQGEQAELSDLVISNRSHFVLKPADSWGGQGLHFGEEHGQEEWAAIVQEALRHDYIVQERLRPSAHTYPVAENGALVERSGYIDLNPYVWCSTDPYGFIARISPTVVTNVARGASVLPVFVIA